MKTVKMSLTNVKGKLNRSEMKNVLGGTLPADDERLQCVGNCSYLLSPNSNVWLIGTCIPTPIPMNVGCACKKQDNTTIPGCI